MSDAPCCQNRGLIYPDGQHRCWRHATDADRALVADLDARAPAWGITPGRDGGGWPYGANLDVEARARMLDWAKAHRLRLSNASRCLHWLRTGRCAVSLCEDNYAQRFWMDHVTTWNRNGKPAVLVAQPYGLSTEELHDLAKLSADPALKVLIDGTGWYGYGTTFVGVWRADQFSRLRYLR